MVYLNKEKQVAHQLTGMLKSNELLHDILLYNENLTKATRLKDVVTEYRDLYTTQQNYMFELKCKISQQGWKKKALKKDDESQDKLKNEMSNLLEIDTEFFSIFNREYIFIFFQFFNKTEPIFSFYKLFLIILIIKN